MANLLEFSVIQDKKPKQSYRLDKPKAEKKIDLLCFAPYSAMFGETIPHFLIEEYSEENDTVYDPFSGRGTTLAQARVLNRVAIASDFNPYAFVISKAKAIYLDKTKILDVLQTWKKQFVRNKSKWEVALLNSKFQELHYYYSKKTLAQLLFLRTQYGEKWKKLNDSETFLLALALGIMHGPSRKDRTTIYFSVDMPNTISMAPNYVKNYVQKHNLTIPEVDIFDNIANRFKKYYEKNLNCKRLGKVFFHDANKTIPNEQIPDNSIDLVITSPPYLNITNYAVNNWLKLWLLGYERKELRQKIPLSDNLKGEEYKIFITNFLNKIFSKLKPNAHLCLVVGDVHGQRWIEDIWQAIKDDVFFKLIKFFCYENSQNRKTSNILNKKAGKATKTDKFLILKKLA